MSKVIAEGGFGVVFLVKLSGNSHNSGDKRCALKRLFVNNDKDLAVCKREIAIVVRPRFFQDSIRNSKSMQIWSHFQSNLNGHPNLIGYIDSSVSLLADGVHEVLLLMPYHRATVLQMMNERYRGFSPKWNTCFQQRALANKSSNLQIFSHSKFQNH